MPAKDPFFWVAPDKIQGAFFMKIRFVVLELLIILALAAIFVPATVVQAQVDEHTYYYDASRGLAYCDGTWYAQAGWQWSACAQDDIAWPGPAIKQSPQPAVRATPTSMCSYGTYNLNTGVMRCSGTAEVAQPLLPTATSTPRDSWLERVFAAFRD